LVGVAYPLPNRVSFLGAIINNGGSVLCVKPINYFENSCGKQEELENPYLQIIKIKYVVQFNYSLRFSTAMTIILNSGD